MYKISGKGSASKKKAWKWFSLYIRLRDCLVTTGTPTACKCVTCGKVVPWDDIDAGHSMGHRQNSVLLDEELVYGQCQMCNRFNGGEKQAFKIFLVHKHGLDWYELKDQGSKQAVQISDMEFEVLAEEYRKKYNALRS
jgi:hypothetical protein